MPKRRRRGRRWLARSCSSGPFRGESIGSPPSAATAAEFRAQARPQPSVTPACPTSPLISRCTSSGDCQPSVAEPTMTGGALPSQITGRSDMRGCAGRLRSSLSSKRRPTCRGTRRLLCFGSSRPSGTFSGQPGVSAAATPLRIRASDFGRHEHRNRSYSSSSICPCPRRISHAPGFGGGGRRPCFTSSSSSDFRRRMWW